MERSQRPRLPEEPIDRLIEPHERGGILVAAVFDAFFTVYSHRMADLLRIARVSAGATGGGAAVVVPGVAVAVGSKPAHSTERGT